MSQYDFVASEEDVRNDFHLNLRFGDSEWKAVKYILDQLTDQENVFAPGALDWFEIMVNECAPYMRGDNPKEAEKLLGAIESAIDIKRRYHRRVQVELQ